MSRAKEADREKATRVHTTHTRLIAIRINGEASDFADVIDEAFRMAREAAASKTAINKSIVRKGVRADVKVDP